MVNNSRILITGAGGFVGRHLCAYIYQKQSHVQLIGAELNNSSAVLCDRFVTLDLTDEKAVDHLIQSVEPHIIIHLAGSFGTHDKRTIYLSNVKTTELLLEAASKYIPEATFISAGSAAEYGEISKSRLPVTEDYRCKPVSYYGMSKKVATELCLFYFRTTGLKTMVFRPFQIIGKGVSTKLAPGAFHAKIIAAIEKKQPEIRVGNLASQRDFLDIDDTTEAIWGLCRKPAGGQIYNICSGIPVQMSFLLDTMIKQTGTTLDIKQDPGLLRPGSDVSIAYGSFEKLHQHCNWSPQIPLAESVKKMFQ